MGRRGIMLNSNFISHKVQFNNTKTARLTFPNEYTQVPHIQLTMEDSGNVPVFRQKITTKYVKIALKQRWTGTISVLVIEE